MAEQGAQTAERPVRTPAQRQGSDIGRTLAGDGTGRALVGGGTHMPQVADDVLEVEGAAASQEVMGARPEAISAWLFRCDEPTRQVDLVDLPRIVSLDENFAWIDLSEYGEKDLREVAGLLDLHDAAVRTALAQWQRPTLDVFDDQFFVSATVAHVDPGAYRVRATQLDLFVGRNYLLSAHRRPLPFADRIMGRARHNPDLVQLDSAFMLYIVLDELVEYYEGLGEWALRDTSDAFLGDLLQFKRFAFALGRLADQHREVFAAFLRPDFAFVSGDETEPYFRDLQERLARLLDQSLAANEAVNGAFDIYVSHMSHRTSQIMKILTIVSTALLPASVILALFSASFEGLPNYGPVALVAMIATTAVFTMAITLAIRRRGWL